MQYNAILLFLVRKLSVFQYGKLFWHVNKHAINRLTWGRGSLRPKTLLLWDLENVPFAYFEAIKKKLAFAPEKAFIITKQNLSEKTVRFMEQNGFEIFTKHKTDSDTKIKKIYKILNLYEEFVIVSSDSDFIPMGKQILAQRKNLTWIMRDIHKKRVLMKINLTSPTLRLVTLTKEIPL